VRAYPDRIDYALLSSLTEVDRRAVLASMRRRRFAKGEVLFHEGDLGDSLHLVAKGKVAVRVTTPRGDVATLAVLSQGDYSGELVLLGAATHRTATLAALEAVETLCLRRDAFDELRNSHPAVAEVLLFGLARQVEHLSHQLLDALYMPADQRVVRRLHELAGLYGTNVALTQEELAGVAGTTRPTVNRVLRECAEAGLVALRRGGVEILDAAGLARRARA
jgi:CRP/FNR family cyclic AMP-dependent transcriptional regulator